LSTVLRVTSGNFLEMFDFFLFGFYATHISRPSSRRQRVRLADADLRTFGAGFLMRPLGAIILGATSTASAAARA
jgi:MHS family citrate/tricarballylate:H+ symporter-like MFS transporter